jgi:hypothetical protein
MHAMRRQPWVALRGSGRLVQQLQTGGVSQLEEGAGVHGAVAGRRTPCSNAHKEILANTGKRSRTSRGEEIGIADSLLG